MLHINASIQRGCCGDYPGDYPHVFLTCGRRMLLRQVRIRRIVLKEALGCHLEVIEQRLTLQMYDATNNKLE